MKKSRRKRNLTLALSLFLLLCILPVSGFAATQADVSQGIDFTVQAILPENQLDLSHTYFDLSMVAGQQQKLSVEVINLSADPITVKVDAISASTNKNGVIDYKTADIKDETLKYPFSDIAKVENSIMTLPAQGTEVVDVVVTMPEETYDGVILGGLVIAKVDDTTQADTPNPADEHTADSPVAKIKNTYSYVIAVQLRETSTAVQPDFELVSASMGTSNYQPALLYSLRNKEAAVVKDLTVEAKLYAKGDPQTPVLDMKKEDVEMAPNSAMELAMGELDKRLTAGTYDLALHMYTQDKQWDLQTKVKIDDADVQQVEDGGVSTKQEEQTDTAALYGIIVVLTAVVVVLIVLMIRRSRRQRKSSGQGTSRVDRYTK